MGCLNGTAKLLNENLSVKAFMLNKELSVETSIINKAFIVDTSIVCSANKPILPYDAEIEYLEGSGTQYIDTNIIPSPTIGYYFIFSLMHSSGAGNNIVFGCTDSGVYAKGAGVGFDTLQNVFYFGGSLTRYVHTIVAKAIYEISINYNNNGLGKINDFSTELTKPAAFTTSKTVMFNIWNNGPRYSGTHNRFYKIIITDGTQCIFSAIPVRIGNVGYMYDTVSGQLFGNAGTGDFILGPDK